MEALSQEDFIHGRGAQLRTGNKFLQLQYVREHSEGLDEAWELSTKTQFFAEHPKKMVNKVTSPDIGLVYSMNPYQGCEHGCIYCYARNTHEYYGFSAGLDFESKIIVKPEAPEVLRKQFSKKNWEPDVIMLAGNTDCYQPAEQKFEITRRLLEACLEFRNPVGIITKNALVLRDTDILQEMAKLQLVHVHVSITTLDESIRRKMEPRTATAAKRLEVVRKLSEAGVPTGIMAAPMIPFINSHELPAILKASAEAGALSAGYTMVRLNGAIGPIFTDWINRAFPDKAERVLNQIKAAHGGGLNDSRYGTRMRGEGSFAESIAKMFRTAYRKYFQDREAPPLRTDLFRVPPSGQLGLFDS